MTTQPDLFTQQAQSIHDLPKPKLSYADATLNFTQYQEERSGFKQLRDDNDEPLFQTITRCSLPTWAEIPEVTAKQGSYGFTIYGEEHHQSAGEVINWWLERIDYTFGKLGKDTPPGKWILEHAEELNSARRYWDAAKQHNQVCRTKAEIMMLQERLRKEELQLGVLIRCAAEDRNIEGLERKVLLKELGATEEDLAA